MYLGSFVTFSFLAKLTSIWQIKPNINNNFLNHNEQPRGSGKLKYLFWWQNTLLGIHIHLFRTFHSVCCLSQLTLYLYILEKIWNRKYSQTPFSRVSEYFVHCCRQFANQMKTKETVSRDSAAVGSTTDTYLFFQFKAAELITQINWQAKRSNMKQIHFL